MVFRSAGAERSGTIFRPVPLAGGVQFYKQIIHLQEKHYGPNNVELAISTNKLGEILFGMGELEMARMHFDK